MKTIICPIDFSSASINAIEYAAKMAKDVGSQLELIHVQEVEPVAVYAPISNVLSSRKIAFSKLKKMCTEVTNTYHVSCISEVETSNKSLEKILSEKSKGDYFIVMGTNGADDIHQYFFGTNSFAVLERAACPVLIIPEGELYKPIKKIVFAWDYKSKNNILFNQFDFFIELFKPEINLIHVSKEKTQVSLDLFNAYKDVVDSKWGDKYNITFEQIFSDDIEKSLNEYMTKSDADLLMITFYNRGFIGNIFHGQLVMQLSEEAVYPLLVLHI